MRNVNLFQAWYDWWQGGDVKECYLYPMKILWWGRIGKVIQLIAALAIVAEIIGPERFQNLATSLRRRSFFSLSWLLFPSNEEYSERSKTINRRIRIVIIILIAVLGSYYLTNYVSSKLNLEFGGFFLLIYGLSFIVIFVISSVIAWLIINFGFLFIEFGVLWPLLFVFDRPNLLTWVKVISVILLLVGFHFDLLAS